MEARKYERKTQFNVVIDRKLKNHVKKMAKICRITVSAFTEHSFEVGLHYIEQTLKDEKKRKMLDKIQLLSRQAVEAGQANNLKSIERYQSELFREMIMFINWITELRDSEKYRV